MLKKMISPFLLLCLFACEKKEAIIPADTSTYEAYLEINPASFPAGGGLDLDNQGTGGIAQLDADPSFDYDLKMLTFRTSKGGRPAIFLAGNTNAIPAVAALNVSDFAGTGLGDEGFGAFERVSALMIQALKSDGIFDFDPTTDLDDEGKPDVTILTAEYQKLVIGDKVVNLETEEQPVFLIRTLEGTYFKFQHVKRENGGRVLFRWARFGEDAIE